MPSKFPGIAPVFAGAAVLAGLALATAPIAKTLPLAVLEQGSGSPTIVLIHSIGGGREDWSAVLPLLASHHRVLVVELPGHGQSPPPDGPPTVEKAAASLDRILAERKVDRAILVGHSYGALVALRSALNEPKRAAAIVAVDAATYTTADAERVRQADKILKERYTVFLSAVYEAMTRNPATGDSLFARARRVDPTLLTEYFRDSWKEDMRPRLKSLKKPVHVVATDGLWPEGESWTSARKRLGYETAGPAAGHRVSESAHMVALDQPDTLAAIIEAVAAKP